VTADGAELNEATVRGDNRDDRLRADRFDAFYRQELAAQVRRALLMVGSNELANDIVHDAMIGVYRRWTELDNPAGYLNRAVLNGCRDAGRHQQRQGRLLPRLFYATPQSTAQPDVLDDALASLPLNQRAAVILRYFEGQSTAEIAVTLDCPPGSVGPWIDRALDKLRKALG
jgi:RNA polymerase sigma factor (sigma-70 family)